MHDFREKHRTNYMGMVALMNAVDEANLEPVAAYLASLKIDRDSK
jgi:cytochrome c553